MSDAFSDAFVNPSSVGGQRQNLTGDIIPPGGTGITDPSIFGGTQSAPGWGGAPQASGSGGAPVTSWFDKLFPQGVPGLGTKAPATGGDCGVSNLNACIPEIRDFAVRGAVVVLGFIFVAAGLFMFGRNTAVPVVRDVVTGRR